MIESIYCERLGYIFCINKMNPVLSSYRGSSDEEIAKLVQTGDKAAFGELVDRYEAKLARYARKFLANRDDVNDLVQEVFIKAYCNIQSFDASRRFSPWIYRIAHNEFVNALKKLRRNALSFIDFDLFFPRLAAKETADFEANKNDLRQTLDQYLNRLDAKYREPLVLYYFQDLSYKEIADILHIPAATVGVRLQRGKAMLRKKININP